MELLSRKGIEDLKRRGGARKTAGPSGNAPAIFGRGFAVAATVFVFSITVGSAAPAGDGVYEEIEAFNEAPGAGAGIGKEIRSARHAMAEGDFAESAAILEGVLASPKFVYLRVEERVSAWFALGKTYYAQGELRKATRMYRRILSENPMLAHVRLELARTLFYLREDRNADFHFRLALAGDLPEASRTEARDYLRAIRGRPGWAFRVRAGGKYNSNVNFAPRHRHIEVNGVVFTVPDAAQSAFGFSTGIQAEYQYPLTENTRLRVAGYGGHTHFTDSRYHVTIIGGRIGPRFLLENARLGPATVSLLVDGHRRWLGLDPLNTAVGPTLEATVDLSDRLRIGGQLSHSFLRYDDRDDLHGGVTGLRARPEWVLSPVSLVGLKMGVAYRDADAGHHQAWQYLAGLDYHRDMTHGFIVGLHPMYLYSHYEEEHPFFRKDRRDHVFDFRVSLINRRIEWEGFTPVLAYRYLERRSTIDLFEFEQHRIELYTVRDF